MTRICVVLATYHGAAFLPEQLASLAQQTRLPDELIIADDASSDAVSTPPKAWRCRLPCITFARRNVWATRITLPLQRARRAVI